MKISIIVEDKFVSVDGVPFSNLIWEGTPDDVHALQWKNDSGWIEYIDKSKVNEVIDELPVWAQNAYNCWLNKYNEPPELLPTIEQNIHSAKDMINRVSWIHDKDILEPREGAYILQNRDVFEEFINKMNDFIDNPSAGPQDIFVEPQPVFKAPI